MTKIPLTAAARSLRPIRLQRAFLDASVIRSVRRPVVAGIAATALIVLVTVASAGYRRSGGPSGGATGHVPRLIGDYHPILALILVPIGAIASVWVLIQSRRKGESKADWHWTLVAAAVLTLLFGGALYMAKHLVDGHPDGGKNHGAAPIAQGHVDQTSPTKKARKQKPSESAHQFHFRGLPALMSGAVLLGVAVSLGAAARQRRQQGAALEEQAPLAAALDEIVVDGLDDLQSERDPRLAVIRAYARMEQTFAVHGVPREKADTPLEYLARVLGSISVSPSSARGLTELYERAKFSPHAIDETMKDDAIVALGGLRAELEQTTGRSLSSVSSPSSSNPPVGLRWPSSSRRGTTPARFR
jgi:uncharacterized protein DUF4129